MLYVTQQMGGDRMFAVKLYTVQLSEFVSILILLI